jgi:hypothetical protein
MGEHPPKGIINPQRHFKRLWAFFRWFAGITQHNSMAISVKYAKIGVFVNSEIAK